MPVVLRTQGQVIDDLRASRKADDVLTRLQEGSLEQQREQIRDLVESTDWRYGPATLLATHRNHAVTKTREGHLVKVEWHLSPEDFSIKLGRAKIHEMQTPVADLGHEVIETAKTAVDHILDENFDDVRPMMTSIASALDVGGSLRRRIETDLTVRSVGRTAWWRSIIEDRSDYEGKLPEPVTEGENPLSESVSGLLTCLHDVASSFTGLIRGIDQVEGEKPDDLEPFVRDVAEDLQQSIRVLSGVDLQDEASMLPVYEAVMGVLPYFFNALGLLAELANAPNYEHPEGQD